MTRSGDDPPVPGVRSTDHTADIGIEVEAPDLPELFRSAALGTLWMALGRVPEEAGAGSAAGRGVTSREVRLEEEGAADLLRAWLREVLYWQEVEGFALSDVVFRELEGGRLVGTATGVPSPTDPVREIKGVTWHGLRVEPGDDGWLARVIFDV